MGRCQALWLLRYGHYWAYIGRSAAIQSDSVWLIKYRLLQLWRLGNCKLGLLRVVVDEKVPTLVPKPGSPTATQANLPSLKYSATRSVALP